MENIQYELTDIEYSLAPYDYNKGQSNDVDGGSTSIYMKFKSLEDAFEELTTSFGLFPIKFNKKDFMVIDDYIYTDILVNYNISSRGEYDLDEASEEDIRQWQNGDIKLYNLHLAFKVVVTKTMSHDELVDLGIESYN